MKRLLFALSHGLNNIFIPPILHQLLIMHGYAMLSHADELALIYYSFIFTYYSILLCSQILTIILFYAFVPPILLFLIPITSFETVNNELY